MDRTPSLGRALVGLATLIAVIVLGFIWLGSASDDVGREPTPNAERVITFIRSGGFTGAIDTLVLNEDGSGRLSGDNLKGSGVPVVVSGGRMRDLLAEMDDVWPNTPGAINEQACADCFQYDITFREVRVTVYDPPPRRLQKPIDLLSQIMKRVSDKP